MSTRVLSFEDWSISTTPCLRRVRTVTSRGERVQVLGVGIDWAEEFRLVALGRPAEGVFEVARVEHTPTAVAALITRVLGLEPDPAEVRVVIETRHGLLVEALVDAGVTVLPVNPDLVARRRGPARKKDDAEDARIACLLALDRFTDLRALVPHGELAGELRAIARDDVGAALMLKLLERWPTAAELAAADRDQVEAFARAARHGWPDRFAGRVADALAAEHFQARDYLVRAKAATIRLAATQLLLIRDQRRAWQHRMGELLLGAPRYGRNKQPGDDRGPAVPGGEVYLSFPGLGDRLAARIAGEIGDAIGQFTTPNALQCYAGKAPVTRRSGKSELVVATRLACNRFLADAVQHWAFTSLKNSGWAREFYDTQRHRGKTHNAALRALGNRWLEVLWHCLTRGVPYDENVHVANRDRALSKTA